MPDDYNAAFYDRYVLYFDLLGSSEAATTWPRERLYEFVDLLRSIAHAQSSEAIDGEAQEDGSYRISITPEITTFSDHIVASWGAAQGEHISEMLVSLWTEIVCKDAIRILQSVVEVGLRIGLLVRGGFSFGQLYHEGGVVFGEAMVDAYKIESEVAKTARVVVSERVIRRLNPIRPENSETLLRDESDQQWHLNYFTEMMRHAAPPGDEAIDQASRWKHAHLDRIDREVETLRLRGASGPAAKWEWFKVQFETATARIP
jgi:class 3 adenylate cyclase